MKKKSKSLNHALSRRQLLNLFGYGAAFYAARNPLEVLFDSLGDGLIAKANAADVGGVKNYISILCNGAPTRWVWDNFLQPNGPSDPFVRNKSVNNWLSENTYSGDNTKVEHRAELITLTDGTKLYGPPIWNRQMPIVGGGTVPMHSLLDNSMIIRGVHMQVDIGHAKGPIRVVRPNLSAPSLNGLVADAATTPIPAVGISPFGYNLADPAMDAFKAPKGAGVTLIKGLIDPLNNVLSAFKNEDPIVKAAEANLKSYSPLINNALNEMALYAQSGKPGADALYKMRGKAENLFYTSFGDLKANYNTLYAKYSELEMRCARTAIPNIIPPTGIAPYNLATGNYGTRLAGQFAVAEFLIKNNLSTTITITAEGFGRVAGLFNQTDEHGTSDRQLSLICHSFYFLSLSSMIYELKKSLGPMWNNTVVEVSAEYDRSPKDDQSGSDHAPESNVMSLFSGAIPKHMMIGNVKVNGRAGLGLGTWGVAAPVITNFSPTGTIITNEHVASTVAALLGVESPSRAKSLITVDAAGIQIEAEAPKNVA